MVTKAYMNLFHHYMHEGTVPYENNLSRGLAIILEEEPLMLRLMIDLAKSKGADINYPSGSYDVGFQTRCSIIRNQVYDSDNIIGIALTADDLDYKYIEEQKPDGDLITDIVINYDDTWIIVEVKRDTTDCREQLISQMLQCGASKELSITTLTWGNIMEQISIFIKTNRGNVSRIVSDYFEEMDLQHPEWCPVSSFDLVDINDNIRIGLRVEKIKKEFLNIRSDDLKEKYTRDSRLALDWEWASDLNMDVVNDFSVSNKEMGAFWIGVWPCHLIPQYRTFINNSKLSCLNSKEQEICVPSYGNYTVLSVPYFRLYTQLKNSNIEIYFDNLEGMKEVYKSLKGEVGRHNEEQWDELIQKIKDSGRLTEEGFEKLNKEFDAEYRNKDYRFVYFTIGIDFRLIVPYSDAQLMDKQKGNMALFVNAALPSIKEFLLS